MINSIATRCRIVGVLCVLLLVHATVCRAGSGIDLTPELRISSSGSSAPDQFILSPDETKVFISGYSQASSRVEVHAVPLDGGPAYIAFQSPVASTWVQGYELSADGNHLLVGLHPGSNSIGNSSADLYTVPSSGGTVAKLGEVPVQWMFDTQITGDSQHVLKFDYINQVLTLVRYPVSGGAGVPLTEDLGPLGVSWCCSSGTQTRLAATPDGQYGIVLTQNDDLIMVPIHGGSNIKLNEDGDRVTNLSRGMTYEPGVRMVYSYTRIDDNSTRLFTMELGGDMTRTRLNNGNKTATYSSHIHSTADGRVAFSGFDPDTSSFRPYTQAYDGADAPIDIGDETWLNPYASVLAYTPDDAGVLYLAYSGDGPGSKLYLAPGGGGAPVVLGPNLSSRDKFFEGLAPDGGFALIKTWLGAGRFQLSSVPLAGGPAVSRFPFVDGDDTFSVGDAYITADSKFVIAQVSRQNNIGSSIRYTPYDLYMVPIGGGEAVRINGLHSQQEYLSEQFTVTSDSSRVVYKIDRGNQPGSLMVSGLPLTAVDPGVQVTGEVAGGVGFGGGVGYEFDSVLDGGTLKADYSRSAGDELPDDFGDSAGFLLGTDQIQWWDMSFDGTFTGSVALTFTYDENLLGPEVEEDLLGILHQLPGGSYEVLEVLNRDPVGNTITVSAQSFSYFTLGVVPEPGVNVCILLLLGFRACRRARC